MQITAINKTSFERNKNNQKKLFEPEKLYNKKEAIDVLLDWYNRTKKDIEKDEAKINELESATFRDTKLLKTVKFDLAVLKMRITDIENMLDIMKKAPDDEKMMIRLNIMG